MTNCTAYILAERESKSFFQRDLKFIGLLLYDRQTTAYNPIQSILARHFQPIFTSEIPQTLDSNFTAYRLQPPKSKA